MGVVRNRFCNIYLFDRCTMASHQLVPNKWSCWCMDCRGHHMGCSDIGRFVRYKMEGKHIETGHEQWTHSRWLHSGKALNHIHLYLHCTAVLSSLLHTHNWRKNRNQMKALFLVMTLYIYPIIPIRFWHVLAEIFQGQTFFSKNENKNFLHKKKGKDNVNVRSICVTK